MTDKTATENDCLLIWTGVYDRILRNKLFPQVLFSWRHSLSATKTLSIIMFPVQTYLPLEDRMYTDCFLLKNCRQRDITVNLIYHSEPLDSEERIYNLPTIGLENVMLYFPELDTRKIRQLEKKSQVNKLPVNTEYASTWSNETRGVRLSGKTSGGTTESLRFFRIIGDSPSQFLKTRKVFGTYNVVAETDFFNSALFFKNKRDGELARRDIFEKGIDAIKQLYSIKQIYSIKR